MSIRAKLKVSSIEDFGNYKNVKLAAVYSSDPNSPNYSWSQATPSGAMNLCITNPAAYDQFAVGREYLVTFSAGDAPAEGYSAHDLASAKAQGFRDGYASAQRGDAAPADNG